MPVMVEDQKTLTDFIASTNFTSDDDEEDKEKKEAEGDVGMEEIEEEVKYLGLVPGEDIRTKPLIVNIKQEDMTKVGTK